MVKYRIINDEVKTACLEAIADIETDFKHPMCVIIKEYKNQRSLEQNSKLHAMLTNIANETGHSVEEIKDFLMKNFGWVKMYEFNGQTNLLRMSTTDLSVTDMSIFIEQVNAWSAQQGIYA